MSEEHLKSLLKKYLSNELKGEEEYVFYECLGTLSEAELERLIDEVIELDMEHDFRSEEVYKNIISSGSFPKVHSGLSFRKTVFSFKRVWAASILVVLGMSLLMWLKQLQQDLSGEQLVTQENFENDEILLPNERSARLTLANGQTLNITDTTTKITLTDGLLLERLEDNVIALNWNNTESGTRGYTFSTPKGVSYQLKLPDGTKVWLNTDSEIELDNQFGIGERKVVLKGEAYFEVARNVQKPFKVEAMQTEVAVLGTMFNVQAYEASREVLTTLAEGSVRVHAADNQVTLVPGQQSVYNKDKNVVSTRGVDVDLVLGWKDGFFKFDDQPIEEVLNVLRSWYDIQHIEYNGVFNERFTGSLARAHRLSDLLKGLEMVSDMRFRIEEGRVVVMR